MNVSSPARARRRSSLSATFSPTRQLLRPKRDLVPPTIATLASSMRLARSPSDSFPHWRILRRRSPKPTFLARPSQTTPTIRTGSRLPGEAWRRTSDSAFAVEFATITEYPLAAAIRPTDAISSFDRQKGSKRIFFIRSATVREMESIHDIPIPASPAGKAGRRP